MNCASGIIPFFDDGKTVLLGRDTRIEQGWKGFGGKVLNGETLAETAWREGNRETCYVLNITLKRVQEAEKLGYYKDYYVKDLKIFKKATSWGNRSSVF